MSTNFRRKNREDLDAAIILQSSAGLLIISHDPSSRFMLTLDLICRHSVVTISRVPQALFGRGRRESIAAFPALGRRRDSGSKKGTSILQ